MANFLDKLQIKQAVENTTKLDLSCDHITTANFMQFNVAWCKELVPKEKISVNMETFTRLQPMPVPTFGRARINNRAFFVPFRTVFPGWNDFITDTKHTLSNGTSALVYSPIVDSRIIARFFRNTTSTVGNIEISKEVQTYADSDITIITDDNGSISTPVNKYYKLSAGGRYAKKVLESLGYKIIPYDIQNVSSNFGNTVVTFSALPLLCLAKVYCDWFYPSAYANDAVFSRVDALFKRDDISRLELGTNDLYDIFNLIYRVNYDSDYFVSAWDNPVNPNDGAYSSLVFSDPGVSGPYVTTGNGPANKEPLLLGSQTGISQWALDSLKSLTDYMKRHQLVGARALDRYLARFGVGLTPEKLRRSIYIGTSTSDIQFGDVMSTADTEGASLGNYAGKGLGYGQGNFDFDTDEYGMMIIVNSILPKTGYYQGVNRNVLHVNRTDYWTPEFDNLGTQAIAKMELFVPQNNSWFSGSSNPGNSTGGELASQGEYLNDVFGWTPRYAEYKVGRDMLTGDMNVPTMSTGLSAWHTLRELAPESPTNMVHNAAFVKGTDADQYSRIFYNTDAEVADKFNVIHHFDVASWSPMKALFDTYEFDSNGKDVTLDANGVKMN